MPIRRNVEGPTVANETDRRETGEPLAGWRSAERDMAAAHRAAKVAALALSAAQLAEEAATEVEAAATAAAEAVERARGAAMKARAAAEQAAEASRIGLSGAEGDKVRANHDVDVAEEAEGVARDRYRGAERAARREPQFKQ
jgi:hypothetical protein